MKAYLETPRGQTLDEARAAGYVPWFEHNGCVVMVDGASAFAVRLRQGGE